MPKWIKLMVTNVAGFMFLVWELIIYKPSKYLFNQLDKLIVFDKLADLIRKLPPYPALVLCLLSVLVLFPFKILGLWLLKHNHYMYGILCYFAAKVIGGFFFVRVFDLTETSMRKINRVDQFLTGFFTFKNGLIAKFKSSALYVRLKNIKEAIKQTIRNWF